MQSKWIIYRHLGNDVVEDEVTEEEARAADSYLRRYFDSSDTAVRQELYGRRGLIQVQYLVGEPESILIEHARNYPGIRSAVVREEAATAGFRWEIMAWHAGDGRSRGFITHLIDPGNSAIMTLEYDAAGHLHVITKFWDEMPDEAGMVFEYGADGKNVVVGDLEEGETLRFEAVIRALPEPDFYADGFALPPQMEGAAIPSLHDHFGLSNGFAAELVEGAPGS